VPTFEIDFMKKVPTTWDETVFIEGYPGKYCVLARRHNDRWRIVGVNAQGKAIQLDLKIPMVAGKELTRIDDDDTSNSYTDHLVVPETGGVQLTIQPNGGIVLHN